MKKTIFILFTILFSIISYSQIVNANGVGAGFSSGGLDPKAILEARSTTKGFLTPRMTTTQKNAITSPPNSLLLFDSTRGYFNYYLGGWNEILPSYAVNGSNYTSTDLDNGVLDVGMGASQLYLEDGQWLLSDNNGVSKFSQMGSISGAWYVIQSNADRSKQTDFGIEDPVSTSSITIPAPLTNGSYHVAISGSVNGGTKVNADANGNINLTVSTSSGTVTNVGDLPPLFTTSNPTNTPTFSRISQSQNLFYASPNGSSGNPTFRAIASADVPTLNQNTTGSAASLTTPRTIGTITGDATSSGSSFDGTANNSNVLTLATVNSNVGTFGSATQVAQLTANAKGLVTGASNVAIQIAESQVTGLVSDLAGKVTGAASATDNAVARFDTTTGKLIKNSTVTIDNSGNYTTNGTSITTANWTISSGTNGVMQFFNGNSSGMARLVLGSAVSSSPGLISESTGSVLALINGNNSGYIIGKARGWQATGQSTTQAPINITSGTVKTTPASGDIEYDGTHFYGTTSGGTRYQLDQELSTEYVVNNSTTGISSATLNSTYPNVPVGYRVICPSITLGGAIYTKATEAGSSDVWLMISAPVAP